ncbi:MAG TPA: autotransporter domain-containing protein [Caulobacteraceae bacterium]
MAPRRGGRGALLLSTALGCSLLVTPALSRAQDVVVDSDYASSTANLTPAIAASGADVTITSGEAATTGAGSPGIYVPSASGDVSVHSGVITTVGGPATVGPTTYVSAGIAILDGQSVTVTSDQITTSGGGAYGVAISGVAGATLDSGQISTSGNAASGITVDGVTGAISITSDSISTTGTSVVFGGEVLAAEGIYASGDGDITIDSGLINTGGQFAHGILVEGNVGAVNITSGQISADGDSAHGIRATTTSGGVTINAGTTATTGDYIVDGGVNPYDYYPDAITAITGSGDISITSDHASAGGLYSSAIVGIANGGGDIVIDSGSVEAGGTGGQAIYADGRGGPGSNVTVLSDSIVVTGPGSGALAAFSSGDVTVDSGSIESTAVSYNDPHAGWLNAGGLLARSLNGDVSVTSGTISTAGDRTVGIFANANQGDVTVASDSITTQSARGIQVSAAGAITIDSGVVHTAVPQGGSGAHGVMVTAGAGDVNIASDEIVTDGAQSHGIYVANADGANVAGIGAWRAATGGTGVLTIDSGSIDSSAWGMMIDHQGAIDITSGSIASNGPGIYLYGGDAITIDSGSIDTTNGVGIVAWGDDGAVDITSGDVTVGTGGDVGVFAQTTSGDISINATSTTTTAPGLVNGYTADAVGGISQTGDIAIVSGSATTTGLYSSGVFGWTQGAVSITSESIVNTGASTGNEFGGNGILAIADGGITIDSGSIRTTGDHYVAIIADADTSAGDITIASDEIVTEGVSAHGIVVADDMGVQLDGIGTQRPATGGTGMLTIDSGAMDVAGSGILIDHAGAIDITSDAITTGEHGIYLYGGDAITIDSGTIESRYTGIVARGAGGAVNITSGDVLIGEEGNAGVFAQTSTGDITIHAGGVTTTSTGLSFGFSADAVGALSGSGDITIVSDTATTQGLYSSGVFASTGGDVSVTSQTISNSGELGNGILALADGAVTIDAGAVDVTGASGWGIYVEAGGDVSLTSGSVTATGARHQEGAGLGIAVSSGGGINIDSGTVSTLGDEAVAIAANADGDVVLAADSVSTAGADATGVKVNAANATVSVGDVTTTGAGEMAAAVVVVATGDAAVSVSGDVSSASGLGLSLQAGPDSAATVNVAQGASVYGALGAVALDSDTDATLNVGGHLSGDAEYTVALAGGDDIVNLMTGANVQGVLFGGAGLDTLNLNSTVNTGIGIGQSIGAVAGFEALNVVNGYWTLGGDAALETMLTGGTLALTGTLTDDLTIGQNATLQIGAGGTTGDLLGDVQIDGTLVFNRSDEYDFGGDLYGAGTLVKLGDELLILSGQYNFTGTAIIGGGTIKFLNLPANAEIVVDDGLVDFSGTDQTLASLSGEAGGEVNVDQGSLTVNQGGSTVFAGAITGDGSLTVTGGGTLNLTGANTYTGPTSIQGATVKVNGSITSNVNVGDDALLGGSGEIGGDVFVGGGGYVGPGNSPGTLTVDGDFTFASGSTYAAEVEATGAHDQIDVSGATTIQDDVTLMVLAGDGDYARLSTYTILTSDAGVTGEFDNITTNLAFLVPHLVYTGTSVELNLTRNDITFASFALNQNQTNVADVLEAAGFGDALYDAVVVQSAAGSQEAYAELSGELYASLPTVLLQQARYGREAILERAQHAPEGRGAWGEVIGSQLDIDETTDHMRVKSEGRGFVLGADAAMNGWRAGVAVSQIKSDVDVLSLGSTSDVKSTTVSAYGATQAEPLKAVVGASYTRHDADAQRTIAFPGFTDATTADFDGTGSEVFGELSLSTKVDGIFLEPFIGIAYTTLSLDGFDEEGGDAALRVAEVDRDITTAKIGIRASTSFETGMGTVTPHASVALQGVSGDDDALLNAAFQGAGGYTIAGAPANDGVAFDVGARLDRGAFGLSASYSGVEGDGWSDNKVQVGVFFRF